MIPVPESSEAAVPPALHGERLDRAVTELLGAGISRSRLSRWIREGRVEVDGRVTAKPGLAVESGQTLRLIPPDPEEVRERISAADPVVIYEDEWLAVLDKPSGLAMHGVSLGDPRPSVAAFVARRWGGHLPTNQGPERPGIVHRLDAETSGVCVVAFEESAFADLQEQFAQRTVEKEYRALCYGRPRFLSDWIDRRLARDPRHPERVRVVNGMGPETRDALTYWELLERFEGFAHLLLRPKTGRTHQIRAHLASIHLPILGDRLYRARNYGPGMLPEGAPPVGRTMLHAHRIRFEHPGTGEAVVFRAELAEDMSALLSFLEEHAPAEDEGWT